MFFKKKKKSFLEEMGSAILGKAVDTVKNHPQEAILGVGAVADVFRVLFNTKERKEEKKEISTDNEDEETSSLDYSPEVLKNISYDKLLNAINTFAKDTGLSVQELKDELEKIKPSAPTAEESDKSRIRISLAGAFSCGKSSFINSLLGEDVAPVAIRPSTRVVTRFKYGESRKYLNNLGNEITLKEYQELAVKPRENNDSTNIFSILIPAPFLRNIVLSDVPGFGSGDNAKADDEVSRKENENADIIFYLVDCDKGTVTQSDIDDLIGDKATKKGILNIGNKRKKLCVIITKMDDKPPSKRAVIKKSVESALEKNHIEAKIYSYATKFKNPKDKEFFEQVRQELCSEISFLAKTHNDIQEQRLKKRAQRNAEKNQEIIKNIINSIEVNYQYWWNAFALSLGVTPDVLKSKSIASYESKLNDYWDVFEKFLKKEIEDIDFCKFVVSEDTFRDDYAVKKCDWQKKWIDLVDRKVDIFISNNRIEKDFESYFSLKELRYISIQVEEMGYDWDLPFCDTEKNNRIYFAKNQNKKLRDSLFNRVKQRREKAIKKLNENFGSKFKFKEDIKNLFDAKYNQLLSSIVG